MDQSTGPTTDDELDLPTAPPPRIRIDRPADRSRPTVPSPRSETADGRPSQSRLDPTPLGGTDAQPPPSRARRMAQGAIVVGLGAVAAGLAFALPGRTTFDGDTAGSTTRLETADTPVASASLLAAPGELQVGGQLTDTGELGRSEAPPIRLGDPVGGVTLDAGELNTVIELPDQPTTTVPGQTTTTEWVEPALPPEGEWVDAGNGVLVPDVLLRIRFCESTNNYLAANGYSSARGAYQFLTMSWEWYGHAERFGVAQAHLATPAQQDQAALATLQAEGTGPWAESRPCWSDPDIDPRYATAAPPSTPPPSTTTTSAPSTTSGPSTTEGSSSTSTTTESTTTEDTTSSTTESTTTTANDTTTETTSSG